MLVGFGDGVAPELGQGGSVDLLVDQSDLWAALSKYDTIYVWIDDKRAQRFYAYSALKGLDQVWPLDVRGGETVRLRATLEDVTPVPTFAQYEQRLRDLTLDGQGDVCAQLSFTALRPRGESNVARVASE